MRPNQSRRREILEFLLYSRAGGLTVVILAVTIALAILEFAQAITHLIQTCWKA